MKKEEYMSQLKEALREFDPDLVQEIVSDYEERFRVGAENGRTEEEIIAELGSVEELLEDLRELSGSGGQKQQSASGGEEFRKTSGAEESGSFRTINLNLDQIMEQVGKAVKQAETAANKAMEKVGLRLDNLSRRMNRRETGNDWYVFTGETQEKPAEESAEERRADAADRRTQQLKELELAGIRRIVVGGANFEEICLKPSENEKLQLQCERESYRAAMVAPLYCERREDSLYIGAAEEEMQTIRFKSSFFQCSVGVSEGGRLLLRLPETLCEVVITGEDCDVSVNDCQLGFLTVTLDGGDVRLEETGVTGLRLVSDGGDAILTNLKAGELTLVADGGDITLQETEAERLTVTADGGDVSMEKLKLGEGKIVVDGGDITLQETEAERLTVTADGGDVSMEKLKLGEGKAVADGGDISLRNSAVAQMLLYADGGEIACENCTGSITTRRE